MREKLKYDEQEVDEIIQLKIDDLKGDISKLTFNNVKSFNKKIAQNPFYVRSNGLLYANYSDTFWGDGNYYGYQQVCRRKEVKFKIVGETFTPETKDILVLVNKYINNPQKLTQKLVKLFEDNDKELADLRIEMPKLSSKIKELEVELERFKRGFVNVFMNSAETHNSLTDVYSLRKSEDCFIRDELQDMFNDDFNIWGQIKELPDKLNLNVVPIRSKPTLEDKMKELEKEGF